MSEHIFEACISTDTTGDVSTFQLVADYSANHEAAEPEVGYPHPSVGITINSIRPVKLTHVVQSLVAEMVFNGDLSQLIYDIEQIELNREPEVDVDDFIFPAQYA